MKEDTRDEFEFIEDENFINEHKDAFNELREMFLDGIKKNNIKIKNPDVTLFMIIELVSATAFNAITYKKPLSIEEYKPYLYSTIRLMLRNEN